MGPISLRKISQWKPIRNDRDNEVISKDFKTAMMINLKDSKKNMNTMRPKKWKIF